MKRPPPTFDSQGRRVGLGETIGTGGEGAVFHLAHDPERVAKLYHEAVSSSKAAKLPAMVGGATPELLAVAAWPTGTLHDQRGSVIGLTMPKVQGHREIHHLYSPAQRKTDFPRADWSFMVATADNIARAFGTIHQFGHVIGDVNQGNVVVSDRAVVRLIDCDSFQISARGQLYPCEVGVAHFTPPELQGRSFRGVVRTVEHDRFGLAVLLFHLLFMGRHPFAGRYAGPGDMPIERAITEGRFAFGSTATSQQMSPPPHVLRLAQVSAGVAHLFERAFTPPRQGQNRPSADEWVRALGSLRAELTRCSAHPGHAFPREAGSCPWCEIERGGGPDFFISLVSTLRVASNFDLERVWQAIQTIAVPDATPPVAAATSLSSVRAQPIPAGMQAIRVGGTVAGWAAAASGVAMLFVGGEFFFIALLLWVLSWAAKNHGPFAAEREQRLRIAKAAEAAQSSIDARWVREVKGGVDAFSAKRRELERAQEEYRGLAGAYQRERAALNTRLYELQLQKFLDRHLIEHAQLKRIGSSLRDALASFGVETAADVSYSSVSIVPGFGPARTEQLLAWRRGLESRFQFNPSAGVDPADVAALDQKFARLRSNLERTLSQGAADLQRAQRLAQQARTQIEPEYRRVAEALMQAKADAAAA